MATSLQKGRWILLSVLTSSILSCHTNTVKKIPERSFYYWKSVLKTSEFELAQLDSLQAKTIYLKFFDVDLNAAHQPVPKAKLIVQDSRLTERFNVIPVVFIANACLQQADSVMAVSLARQINDLLQAMLKNNRFRQPTEIQIDCDWTATTRNSYFCLLKELQLFTQTPLSVTIRLHQLKFVSQSGVPPVHRGLLMCYNMGDLKNPDAKNSILEANELKKYTGRLSTYPLPLDVGLPLFEWKVLFRRGVYQGLIENMPDSLLTGAFTKQKGALTELQTDTVLSGYALKKGDLLRDEKSDVSELAAVATEINGHLQSARPRIAFYHLDSVILSKFTAHDLESLYHIFH